MVGEVTRREFLRLNAGTLLALGLWPGRLRADDLGRARGFTFLVVNDLHFFNEECWPWFEGVAREMKIAAPDAEFCLLCGDLADSGLPDQHDGIRDAFETLGILLRGDEATTTTSARPIDGPTKEHLKPDQLHH